MEVHRGAGPTLSAGACDHGLPFVARQAVGDADLAYDARTYAGIARPDPGVTHTVKDIGHDLLLNLFGRKSIHFRRMPGLLVVAGGHHDVNACLLRDAPEALRISPDPLTGDIDEGFSTGPGKCAQLFGGKVRIGEHDLWRRVPDQQMLVRQGDAHRVGLDRAEDGDEFAVLRVQLDRHRDGLGTGRVNRL